MRGIVGSSQPADAQGHRGVSPRNSQPPGNRGLQRGYVPSNWSKQVCHRSHCIESAGTPLRLHSRWTARGVQAVSRAGPSPSADQWCAGRNGPDLAVRSSRRVTPRRGRSREPVGQRARGGRAFPGGRAGRRGHPAEGATDRAAHGTGPTRRGCTTTTRAVRRTIRRTARPPSRFWRRSRARGSPLGRTGRSWAARLAIWRRPASGSFSTSGPVSPPRRTCMRSRRRPRRAPV